MGFPSPTRGQGNRFWLLRPKPTAATQQTTTHIQGIPLTHAPELGRAGADCGIGWLEAIRDYYYDYPSCPTNALFDENKFLPGQVRPELPTRAEYGTAGHTELAHTPAMASLCNMIPSLEYHIHLHLLYSINCGQLVSPSAHFTIIFPLRYTFEQSCQLGAGIHPRAPVEWRGCAQQIFPPLSQDPSLPLETQCTTPTVGADTCLLRLWVMPIDDLPLTVIFCRPPSPHHQLDHPFYHPPTGTQWQFQKPRCHKA